MYQPPSSMYSVHFQAHVPTGPTALGIVKKYLPFELPSW